MCTDKRLSTSMRVLLFIPVLQLLNFLCPCIRICYISTNLLRTSYNELAFHPGYKSLAFSLRALCIRSMPLEHSPTTMRPILAEWEETLGYVKLKNPAGRFRSPVSARTIFSTSSYDQVCTDNHNPLYDQALN